MSTLTSHDNVIDMSTKRAHIVLPQDLVSQIDKIAGKRGRSAFLADLARREIKRLGLVEILKQEEPIWRDEDHSELSAGADQWVQRIGAEAEARFESIQRRREQD